MADWGGETWSLGPSGDRFGLTSEPGGRERLALRGLAATGRRDDSAFGPRSLVDLDVLHGRVLATFESDGWPGLVVRAAWALSADGTTIDLEVQASTSTVGELRRLEILVGTASSAGEGPEPGDRYARGRDRLAAALSYDGRESDARLARLYTLPVPEGEEGPDPSSSSSRVGRGGYLEMVHPQDVSRTIIAAPADDPKDVEYALFGHDLEKGVVLRGRLRGIVLSGEPRPEEVVDLRRRFLQEPPPLRTC